MGCYDTVHARCPVCRAKVTTQSKSGECQLKHYHASAVPGNVVTDIYGERESCPNCSAILVWNVGFDTSIVDRSTNRHRVRMFLDEATHEFGGIHGNAVEDFD